MKIINKKGFFALIVILSALIFVLIIFGISYNVVYAFTEGEETITIKEKWTKYQGESAKYLVSSTSNQVFQITDSIIKWRWDSSNLYASLNEGQKCRIKTQGWRFELFSDYKNIIEASCYQLLIKEVILKMEENEKSEENEGDEGNEQQRQILFVDNVVKPLIIEKVLRHQGNSIPTKLLQIVINVNNKEKILTGTKESLLMIRDIIDKHFDNSIKDLEDFE